MEDMHDEYDIISLAPNMRQLFGTMLSHLRERGEANLYAILANHCDTEFNNFNIIIHTRDESSHKILHKHRKKLENITGPDTLVIHKPTTRTKTKSPKTDRLRELFGDALTVK